MSELLRFPIWTYRDEARRRARRRKVSPTRALRDLLVVPTRWLDEHGRAYSIVPSEQIAEAGVTVDEYIDSWLAIHELGAVEWDARERRHLKVIPREDAPNTK